MPGETIPSDSTETLSVMLPSAHGLNNIKNSIDSRHIGAMEDCRNENALTGDILNKNQIQGTALGVLMENSARAFKTPKNYPRRRLFGDVTNRLQHSSRIQKQKVQKHIPRQTAITEFAVVKRKISNFGVFGKNDNEASESSKHDISDDSGCFSSVGSIYSTKSENACLGTKDVFMQRTESDEHPPISVDIEMRELEASFGQSLGKRFNAIHLDDQHDEQPLIKRRRESEEIHLEEDVEDNKNEQNVEKENEKALNEIEKTNGDKACHNPYETKYSLLIVKKPPILTAGFACIAKDVLKKLLVSMDPEEFIQKYSLIDCRYPYEYDGGHIKGAVNIYDPVELEETFFPVCLSKLQLMTKKVPIFYCEYSTARGPMFASHLRKSDRVRNYDRYPEVYYKEIYVLEGGYNSFYGGKTGDLSFKKLCEPLGYVSMSATEHSEALQKYRTHSYRTGIGFETGMFQTAVIRKNANFHRTNSAPVVPESPTAEAFASVQTPEKHRSESDVIPMLIDPRTPTGRKKSH